MREYLYITRNIDDHYNFDVITAQNNLMATKKIKEAMHNQEYCILAFNNQFDLIASNIMPDKFE